MTKTMACVLGGCAMLSLTLGMQGIQQSAVANKSAPDAAIEPSASATPSASKQVEATPAMAKRDTARREPTDAERMAFVDSDPQMKAAEKTIAVLINLNGHLCARVLNVEPAGGNLFRVSCVERRSGAGRVQYAFDTSTNTASPL